MTRFIAYAFWPALGVATMGSGFIKVAAVAIVCTAIYMFGAAVGAHEAREGK